MAIKADVLGDIFEWSKELPLWQQDALRRLSTQTQLSESDLDELTSICLGNSEASVLSGDQLSGSKQEKHAVILKNIRNVEHINILAPNQSLSFRGDGLTVVYGDNGSGKSGYARILKKVCRARVTGKAEEIIPSIHDPQPGTPSAVIGYEIKGRGCTFNWQLGKSPDPELSLISVFDSDSANIHVDESNDIAYTPYPLELLASLANLCRLIKDRLNVSINEIKAKTPIAILKPECGKDTKTGYLLSDLAANTDLSVVENLATLTHIEKDRLVQLTSDLSSDPNRAGRRLTELKTTVAKYIASLDRLFDSIGQANINGLNQLAIASDAAHKAATAASSEMFSSEPLPQIDSEVWKSLWMSARAFSEEAFPGQTFPVTGSGSVCVLCQQELSTDAVSRLNRFENFVKNESQRNAKIALDAFSDAVTSLVDARFAIRELCELVRILRDELQQEDLSISVRRATLLALLIHRGTVRHHKQGKLSPVKPVPTYPRSELLNQITEIEQRIVALTAEAGSKARNDLLAELRELTDRQWLGGIKADVLAEINRMKQIEKIEVALRDTATNRITNKSTEVSQLLVTDALRAKFSHEVAALNIAGLAVELKQQNSVHGIPRFKVVLTRSPNATVGKILSEGEYRCVALAAFMAELATTENISGIVFDDPVSSLDHRYREAVASRLVEESKHRQVIVFTHDLAFLFELERASSDCEPKSHIAVISVNRGGDKAGICRNEPPFKARPSIDIAASLKKQLKNERYNHDQGDEDEWRKSVKSISGTLRDTWEIAVEEVVGHVTKRLSNEIKTGGLIKLTVITTSDCEEMRDGFKRCSELLHSASPGLNRPLPGPDDLMGEIEALETWTADLQKRQNSIKHK